MLRRFAKSISALLVEQEDMELAGKRPEAFIGGLLSNAYDDPLPQPIWSLWLDDGLAC